LLLTPGNSGSRLTYSDDGATNNTRILIDGKDLLFGMRFGIGRPGPEHDTCSAPIPYQEGSLHGWRSYRDFPLQKVRVIQDISIRRGGQSGKLDTCLVQYKLRNRDTRVHNVGIRIMLDTFIGGNDGVPFTIPGQAGLCTTWRVFNKAEDVPDFIQALEKPNLRDPGTVAYLQLRFSANEGLERPSSLRLCHWPSPNARWLVLPKPIHEDSAAVIYWGAAPLAAGGDRRVGFSYGLGAVAGGEGEGHLALSLGGTLVAGEDFYATAYIDKPLPRESLTLPLPPGVQLTDGERAEKSVPAEHSSTYAEISWRVRATDEGVYTIKVRSNNGASQTQEARIDKLLAGAR
jgi:hypothetical protein